MYPSKLPDLLIFSGKQADSTKVAECPSLSANVILYRFDMIVILSVVLGSILKSAPGLCT
jgi:hypothetical protein